MKEIKIIVIDDNIEDLIAMLRQDQEFKDNYRALAEKKIDEIEIIQFRWDREDTSVQLDFFSFQISESVNFFEAKDLVCSLIDSNKYDIVLLDYYLKRQYEPDEDAEAAINRGLNMINSLGISFPQVPIVIISSVAGLGDADRVEIQRYATKLLDKRSLSKYLCKYDNFGDIFMKNIALRVSNKIERNNQLPIFIRYNPLKDYLEIKGTFKKSKLSYLTDLTISIGYYKTSYPSYDPAHEVTKSFLRILLKPYKLNLSKNGIIKRILVQSMLKKKVTNKIMIQRYLSSKNQPDYLDYIKNYRYIMGCRLSS